MAKPKPTKSCDPDVITSFIQMLRKEGEVFEIRILEYTDRADKKFPGTLSGFYNNVEIAASDVQKAYAAGTAAAAYITLNPIKPELLAIANNRLKPRAKSTAADTDVVRRSHLLIDVDPVRKSGISSTDGELKASLECAVLIREFLDARGWPAPIQTMSGNGAGLVYPIDLPSDDDDLVKKVLVVLAEMFDTPAVKLDLAVHNPARITKLIGTIACKGENMVGVAGMEDRPHRITKLLAGPDDESTPLQAAQLQTLIADHGAPATPSTLAPSNYTSNSNKNSGNAGRTFEKFPHTADGVESYLRKMGAQVKGRKDGKILLGACPVNPSCESANYSDIAVLVDGSGKISYANLHSRGQGLKWEDVREAYEPGFKAWVERSKSGPPKGTNGNGTHHAPAHRAPAPSNEIEEYFEPPAEYYDTELPATPKPAFEPMSYRQLAAENLQLREPVIDGLLRKSETMNIIAPSKTGKSWMVINLALCAATARTFLGEFNFPTPCNVLIIDNELHKNTINNRIPKVAKESGIMFDEYADKLFVESLRGQLVDLYRLRDKLMTIPPGTFGLIILDAWYRLLPDGTDENDNGGITTLYNTLDALAEHLQCSFICIHHASKGAQGNKSVIDVGSGAGSQSRAVDTHLVLREHEEPGAIVLEAVCRSFPPIKPFCIRRQHPIFIRDDSLDPTQLKVEKRGKGGRPKKSDLKEEIEKANKPAWNSDRFIERFISKTPKTIAIISNEAEADGISARQAKSWVQVGVDLGKILREPGGMSKTGRVPDRYSLPPAGLMDLPKCDSTNGAK